MIAAQRAVAASLLGDRPAFATAITRARRELGRPRPVGTGPLPAWLQGFGDAAVMSAEAAGLLSLGDTGRAVAVYRDALGLAGCPRDRLALASCLAPRPVA